MSDELRERLARLDPMPPGVPTEPMTTPSSRRLLEEVMSTQVAERTSRKWLPAAAAVVAVAAIAAAMALGGGSKAAPLTLSARADDPMAMCLMFSVEELARAEVAFEGVVVAAGGDTVELQVTRWYAGGDADTVILEAEAGMEALIGGVAFEEGQSYLISATDGTVNYCGYSGPVTDEFRAAFEEAFAG
jgi:hypothetical protein